MYLFLITLGRFTHTDTLVLCSHHVNMLDALTVEPNVGRLSIYTCIRLYCRPTRLSLHFLYHCRRYSNLSTVVRNCISIEHIL